MIMLILFGIIYIPLSISDKIIDYQSKQDSLIWDLRYKVQKLNFKIDSTIIMSEVEINKIQSDLDLLLSTYKSKQQHPKTNPHTDNNP